MKKKKIVGANMKVLYNIEKIRELVDDLFWEYDRMSSSGQETLDKLATLYGIETNAQLEERLAKMSEEEMKQALEKS